MGDTVLLSINETSYVIERRGGAGIGAVSVKGNEITFSDANLCDGEGVYRWSLDGGDLVFAPLAPRDPCGGRIGVLEGQVYRRTD